MRIDFDEAPASRWFPVTSWCRSVLATRRFAVRLRRPSGVVDHFVAASFEDWHKGIESVTHDWSRYAPPTWMANQWRWCEAPIRSSRRELRYVATAVLPRRTRLRQAACARRSRMTSVAGAGTILHVDTNNVTPAVDLYLGVGMRPVLAIDVWRGLVPADLYR
jgi:hypothetical protein